MTVTKNVMAPGSFDITLNRDIVPVPFSVTDSFRMRDQAFGHILILPARVEPDDFDDATLFDLSVFTGVYRVQRNRTTLKGNHATIWLGDPNGKGPIREIASTGNFNMATWVAGTIPATLTSGTIGAPGGTLDWSTIYKTPREDLDVIADYFGCEWQVTDNLELNVNTVALLYGASPAVIATPFWEGRDGELVALRCTFDVDESAEEYTTRVLALDNAGNPGSADISPATPYSDGLGNLVTWNRYAGSTDTAPGSIAGEAAGQLARNDQIDQHITASTDAFCPMADVECGAPIYAYDPEKNVYDLDNEAHYAGDITWPMNLRVQSIEMQLREGMGVLFRAGDGTYTDLSDYVAWETGSSRLELGARQTSFRQSQALLRRGMRA